MDFVHDEFSSWEEGKLFFQKRALEKGFKLSKWSHAASIKIGLFFPVVSVSKIIALVIC